MPNPRISRKVNKSVPLKKSKQKPVKTEDIEEKEPASAYSCSDNYCIRKPHLTNQEPAPSFMSRLKKYTKKVFSNRGVQAALGVATAVLAVKMKQQFDKNKKRKKLLDEADNIVDFFDDEGNFKSDVFSEIDLRLKSPIL